MKIHMYEAKSPEEIVERVRRTRELIGMEKKLMVDLHRAWDGKTAVEIARQLEPYNLYWIEEPVRGDDEAVLPAYGAGGYQRHCCRWGERGNPLRH